MIEDWSEELQETVYGLMALNEFNRSSYLTEIIDASIYLQSIQLATGGWENYPGYLENNQFTGEALWGIGVVLQSAVVPDVVGETEPNATAAIVAVDLIVGTVTYQYNDTVAAGLVISQNPFGGTEILIGVTVDLVVSLGQSAVVPNVVDMTEAEANSAITAASLTVGIITYDYNDTVAAGLVISQDPATGTIVPVDSSVDLVVSVAVVPDVVLMTEAAANSTIYADGLIVGTVTYEYSYTVAAGFVISQSPVAGTALPAGSPVDLFVSLGPPIEVPNVVTMTDSNASSTITDASLIVGALTYEYSETMAAGIVISQNPTAGTIVVVGAPVDMVISLGQPIVAMLLGGNRLVELQNNDGGWDWLLLDDGDPNSGSEPETFASVAMGLAKAYRRTRDPNMLAGLQKAKTFLLNKTDNFVGTDGALAVELDSILGGTACMDYVSTNFYDKLEAGIYYDQAQRNRRAGEGRANMAAWDLGLGLYSAYVIGANTTDWLTGLKAEIDELDGDYFYDVLGLAGAVFGLAAVGEDYDPQAGEHAAASSLSDLAESLAGYQLESGGFTWFGQSMVEGEEELQETVYGLMALSEFNKPSYLTDIQRALIYLQTVQLVTGGWENYTGYLEYNEYTGEALRGIAVAVPVLGDLDKDGDVDFEDFAIFASAWLTELGGAKWNPECDISDLDDDIVDELDLAVFTRDWLEGTTP
jgi:beta-lactam-binding protein with PASTA domain